MLGSPMRPNVSKRQLYEAVFISKLTCQLSSFFVQNFVQTTSTLCKERRPLCTNNDDFARTTTTLYKQRRLCTNNDDFARTMTTLSKVHVWPHEKSWAPITCVYGPMEFPTAVVSVVAIVAVGAVLSVGLVAAVVAVVCCSSCSSCRRCSSV